MSQDLGGTQDRGGSSISSAAYAYHFGPERQKGNSGCGPIIGCLGLLIILITIVAGIIYLSFN
jgi:hypothetical protein